MQPFVLAGTEIVLGLLFALGIGAAIGFLARGWYDARLRLRRKRYLTEMRSAAREQVGGATGPADRRRPAPSRTSARRWRRREEAPAASSAAAAIGSPAGEAEEADEADIVAGKPARKNGGKGGPPVRPVDPRRATVLLVDDRLELLAVHSAYLHRAGYQVMTAVDGEEALESARRHHPAVIVLDHSMPRRTGVEVARELKRDPSTADITILLMTAHSYGAIGASARAAGCAAFLPKPCDPSRLLREVARHAPAMAGGSA